MSLVAKDVIGSIVSIRIANARAWLPRVPLGQVFLFVVPCTRLVAKDVPGTSVSCCVAMHETGWQGFPSIERFFVAKDDPGQG